MDDKHQAKQSQSQSQSQSIPKKKPNNKIVCFLCHQEGHYGSPTSCYAAIQVRKKYFN